MTMIEPKISVNGWILRWAREHLDLTDKVDIAEVMPDLIADFVADEDMLSQFLSEALYPYAAQAIRLLMGRGRRANSVVISGSEIQPRESFEKEAQENHTFDFNEWWVHAGSAGYIRLPKLNRSQLRLAIGEDSKRVRTERIRLLFKEKIAQSLPDEKTTVGEVLTSEDLQALHDEAMEEIDGGKA